MAEIIAITNVREHSHPLSGDRIQIAGMQNVWPPYSAFHMAKHVLPIAQTIACRNGHRPIGLDVGTGSGIIPIMAKQHIPSLTMVATDLNSSAVRLAEHNWQLNGLRPGDLTTMVAEGISDELVALLQAQGGVDVLLANLPQQPLVNGTDLAELRKIKAAAWNIDPSRDLDGLGIFQSVMQNAHKVMIDGGVALVSASSKQNRPRIKKFLDGLVELGNAKNWEVVSEERFDVPHDYDPHLINHWKAMEAKDGTPRLYEGPEGRPQYEHLNIAVYF